MFIESHLELLTEMILMSQIKLKLQQLLFHIVDKWHTNGCNASQAVLQILQLWVPQPSALGIHSSLTSLHLHLLDRGKLNPQNSSMFALLWPSSLQIRNCCFYPPLFQQRNLFWHQIQSDWNANRTTWMKVTVNYDVFSLSIHFKWVNSCQKWLYRVCRNSTSPER